MALVTVRAWNVKFARTIAKVEFQGKWFSSTAFRICVKKVVLSLRNTSSCPLPRLRVRGLAWRRWWHAERTRVQGGAGGEGGREEAGGEDIDRRGERGGGGGETGTATERKDRRR